MAFTVTDQALVSGSHFALSLILARWLGPAEYGKFALCYAVALLASSLHSTLILEPMGVIGPARYGGALAGYLRTVGRLHTGMAVAVGAVMLAGAAVLAWWNERLAGGLAAAALAVPWMLYFWLFRRACYLAARPQSAAKAGLAYALLLAAGATGVWKAGAISAGAVFALMAAAGLAASWLFRGSLKPGLGAGTGPGPDWREVARLHWGFARWSLPTTMLYWIASSTYLPMLGAAAGMVAVANYKAADNLMLPVSQTLTALGLLLLPHVSGRAAVLGVGYLRRTALKVAGGAAAAVAAYTVAVVALGPRLVEIVYGAGEYAGSPGLLPFLGVAVLLRAIGDTGIGVAVRAGQRPDLAFWPVAAAAAVTLTAGLALVSRYGAAGAAAGWMASSLASCGVSAWLFRTRLR